MVEHNVGLAANEKTLSPEPVRPVSRIPVLFGFLIIAIIAVAAYLTQRGVSNSTNWVLHTYDVPQRVAESAVPVGRNSCQCIGVRRLRRRIPTAAFPPTFPVHLKCF